jgi:phosphorylated adapter RNA export protein
VDYNPIPRPTAYGSSVTSMKYSDDSADDNDSIDSDSGNDSDSPGFRVKKPKLKKKSGATEGTAHHTSRHSKYNIWCNELQETSLTEELVNCDVRQKIDRSRDVESYNYKLAYTMDNQQDHNVDGFGCESRAFPQGIKRRYGDRGSVKLRLGKKRSNSNESDCRGSPRTICDLYVTLENTNEEVATDIANKLCEEKDDLICKYYNTTDPDICFFLQLCHCWLLCESFSKNIDHASRSSFSFILPSACTVPLVFLVL